MNRSYGWTGKILRVDLTERRWLTEPSDTYTGRFIGGIGLGLKILWDELRPDVGACEPENILVFAPGPLTGTLAPGSGRFEVVSKSPRGYPRETVMRSGMGGFWGPELKFAGYDALVIHGKADDWTNLWICDDHVELKDARDYVGQDTYATQVRLRKELDPKARILCIGPAGEKLSRLAAIISETGFASGRSGFGAVMGSKNLKAVAVRGTKPLRVHDPDRLIRVSNKVRKLAAGNPMREWTTVGFLKNAEGYELINRYRKKNTGCFACPVQCFAFMSVPDSGDSSAHCNNYFYFFKASKYYGNSRERDQAVFDGCVLANRLGLDTYEFSRMVDFLEDLYRAGCIGEETGLPLDKIGSREFIQGLLKGVALRSGMGNLLSEGCARMADETRNGWEFCSPYFPAHGSAVHTLNQMRRYPGIDLMWALDNRDPFVDHHAYWKLSVTDQNRPEPYKLPRENAKAISRKIFGSEVAIDHSTFELKPEAAIYAQNKAALVNMLVVCEFIYPVISSLTTENRSGDTSCEGRLLTAATGCGLAEEELDQVAERVCNLARAIMIREGRTRADDTLHSSYFEERDGERAIPRNDFENAKTRYYQLRGWDEETGCPTREKLRQLELPDIADDLTKGNLLK